MRILVVDDEPALRDSLARFLTFEGYELTFEGYEVELAADGEQALERVAAARPDAVVLDVLMPRLDGLQTCRALRTHGHDVPVLMLTTATTVSDRVVGLDAGADDYLVKPFALEELLARLRALLRRGTAGAPGAGGGTFSYADLRLDRLTHEVHRDERPIELTRTEYLLLELFLRHPRQVLPRSRILEEVWGYDVGPSSNSLEVYVGYLRRKTEAGGEPRLLHTARGAGYVFRSASA